MQVSCAEYSCVLFGERNIYKKKSPQGFTPDCARYMLNKLIPVDYEFPLYKIHYRATPLRFRAVIFSVT